MIEPKIRVDTVQILRNLGTETTEGKRAYGVATSVATL